MLGEANFEVVIGIFPILFLLLVDWRHLLSLMELQILFLSSPSAVVVTAVPIEKSSLAPIMWVLGTDPLIGSSVESGIVAAYCAFVSWLEPSLFNLRVWGTNLFEWRPRKENVKNSVDFRHLPVLFDFGVLSSAFARLIQSPLCFM